MSHDERLRRNDESKAYAEHYGEPWSGDEVEFLLAFWPESSNPAEEAEVAEALGRTIEACRQRRYEVLWGKHVMRRKVTRTTTTEITETYIGALDDDEDRWWDPSYYNRNRNTDQ